MNYSLIDLKMRTLKHLISLWKWIQASKTETINLRKSTTNLDPDPFTELIIISNYGNITKRRLNEDQIMDTITVFEPQINQKSRSRSIYETHNNMQLWKPIKNSTPKMRLREEYHLGIHGRTRESGRFGK